MANAFPQKISTLARSGWPGALNLVLVALLCWQLAQWTWIFASRPPVQAVSPPATKNSEQLLESVRSAHLFGKAADGAPSPQTQSVTPLNLKLSGVFAAKGKLPAVAIIKVENQGDLPFMIGDTVLPDVTLEQVNPDHVVLRRGGVMERLNLEQKNLPQDAIRAQSKITVRREGPGKFGIAKSELDKVLSDPGQLANAGLIKAAPGRGISIEKVNPGKLMNKLGLQEGDVIRSVNGKPVQQVADLLQGYREQLNQGGEIKVKGTRNGQPFEYNYFIR